MTVFVLLVLCGSYLAESFRATRRLQVSQLESSSANSSAPSSCAVRLNIHHKASAGCIITRQNNGVREGLIVLAPGNKNGVKQGGWDLPGGQKEKTDWAACDTAEREACEESGHRVKAVRSLSKWVFECRVVQWNACTKKVDEGRLHTKWITAGGVKYVKWRPKTFGPKQEILEGILRGKPMGIKFDDSPGFNGRGRPNLQQCQGNCRTHSDCASGLRCMHRQGFKPSVPGCRGKGKKGWNYCYRHR